MSETTQQVKKKAEPKVIKKKDKDAIPKFNVGITYDTGDMKLFELEKQSTKYRIIKETIKYLINEEIIFPDSFNDIERTLITNLKNV